jgi:hypothetical protein
VRGRAVSVASVHARATTGRGLPGRATGPRSVRLGPGEREREGGEAAVRAGAEGRARDRGGRVPEFGRRRATVAGGGPGTVTPTGGPLAPRSGDGSTPASQVPSSE